VRIVGLLGLWAGLALPALAAGQTTSNTARLEVSGAGPETNCADVERLRVAVEQRLGRTAIDAQAELTVRVSFEPRSPSGWLARITLEDDNGRRLGEREIVTTQKSCADLDTSLALVTALLVDAPPEPPPESPSPETSVSPEPKPTRLLEPQPEPEPPPPPPEPWRFMIGVSGLASTGRAPGVTAGARLDFDVRPPSFIWLKLEARADLPRTVQDEASGAAADFRHGSLALAACPYVGEGSPSLWLCAGQQLGVSQVSGSALDVNREQTRVGLVVFARAILAIHAAGPMWLRVGLTGGVPLVRDRYIFSGPDQRTHELFRTQPVIATGDLGIAAALP
jgi:hypothetical protein